MAAPTPLWCSVFPDVAREYLAAHPELVEPIAMPGHPVRVAFHGWLARRRAGLLEQLDGALVDAERRSANRASGQGDLFA